MRASLLPDGDLVDAGITEQGQWTLRPAAGAEDLPGRFVLPGLVDAHCHLSVGQTESGPVALEPEAARGQPEERSRRRDNRHPGHGQPGQPHVAVLATGAGAGLQACGRFLAPEGRYYPGLHVPVPPEQLVSAALAEIRDGAAWIKVIADFPFLGPGEQSRAPGPPIRSTTSGAWSRPFMAQAPGSRRIPRPGTSRN